MKSKYISSCHCQAAAINCLTVALSVSPSSVHVNNLLLVEASTGFLDGQRKFGVLYTLFHYSKQLTSPSVSLEALQPEKCLPARYNDVAVVVRKTIMRFFLWCRLKVYYWKLMLTAARLGLLFKCHIGRCLDIHPTYVCDVLDAFVCNSVHGLDA
ncbi:unnamed protein product [Fraxinus pennsylvanica]|uniref:Uncharacterized protein n=1 Tax=Fraxinus pennsylvanica TaxID=56036 RepID=A0AAD2AER8_9LAMI|nr:unnamed protein product [Fraxinus pennsylvanica]